MSTELKYHQDQFGRNLCAVCDKTIDDGGIVAFESKKNSPFPGLPKDPQYPSVYFFHSEHAPPMPLNQREAAAFDSDAWVSMMRRFHAKQHA